jgi:Mn2+/Fe2+ NRAMP family transporter
VKVTSENAPLSFPDPTLGSASAVTCSRYSKAGQTKARYRPTFYGIIAAATLVGVGMNFLHVDPIKALFYSAMINGLVAPPLMVLIVLLGSDRKVMKSKVSGVLSKMLTWTATGAMTAAAAALIVVTFVLR